MKRAAITAGALASIFLLGSADIAAAASHHYYRHHRTHRYYSSCRNHVRHNANRGTVIGAISGGFLGSQLAGRGSRTGGTLIGAGVGAVAGHSIAKSRARC